MRGEKIIDVVKNVAFLGFTSFGGPNIHISVFKNLFINQLQWLDITTFQDLFALSSALPGPGSTQLLFSIALIRGGSLAGILAFLLWSLPGTIGMLILAVLVNRIPPSLPPLALATLSGLNSAAVGLIFFAAYSLSRMATGKGKESTLIVFGSAAISSTYTAVWLFPVLTLGGGLVTLTLRGLYRLREKKTKRKVKSDAVIQVELQEMEQNVPPASTLRHRVATPPVEVSPLEPVLENTFHLSIYQIILTLAIFFSILIAVIVLRSNPSPSAEVKLFTDFYTAGILIFGGGPVVIPLLQGYTTHTVSSQDFAFEY